MRAGDARYVASQRGETHAALMTLLVQPLVEGPLDIVGDVHGEIDALRSLLEHLSYDDQGRHPGGRRLIFVGDLTDRGPDSPAVVDLVRRLVETDRAQCALGNHDLNLLLGWRKYDNPWFYGEEFLAPDGRLLPQRLADEATRNRVLEFLDTLPIALERPGLRVVHAFWDRSMIEAARKATSAVALHEEHRLRIDASHLGRDELDFVARELDHQNLNPAKLLTSGPEERAIHPRHAGGQLRLLQRSRWWLGDAPANHASEDVCVFGHYGLLAGEDRGGPTSFCVDYGVGKRSLERLAGKETFVSRLAALRWPERQIVFDDGGIDFWHEPVPSV